jgi:hypothetical protein
MAHLSSLSLLGHFDTSHRMAPEFVFVEPSEQHPQPGPGSDTERYEPNRSARCLVDVT